jgi:hypothetical protein
MARVDARVCCFWWLRRGPKSVGFTSRGASDRLIGGIVVVDVVSSNIRLENCCLWLLCARKSSQADQAGVTFWGPGYTRVTRKLHRKSSKNKYVTQVTGFAGVPGNHLFRTDQQFQNHNFWSSEIYRSSIYSKTCNLCNLIDIYEFRM